MDINYFAVIFLIGRVIIFFIGSILFLIAVKKIFDIYKLNKDIKNKVDEISELLKK